MTSYLKIKGDIDLSELEKFGFKEVVPNYFEYSNFKSGIEIYSNDREVAISVDIDEEYVEDKILTKLYDLIQAGLIEKVVEE